MAKSCLTENLKSLASQREGMQSCQTAAARTDRQEETQASQSTAAEAGEARRELQAIFAQGSGSRSWKGMTYLGCSPPARSDNGLVRDRVFGRCKPISAKLPFSPSNSSSALSTA